MFFKLTDAFNDETVCVNMDNVVTIREEKEYLHGEHTTVTQLSTGGGVNKDFYVKEPMEQIVEWLAKVS